MVSARAAARNVVLSTPYIAPWLYRLLIGVNLARNVVLSTPYIAPAEQLLLAGGKRKCEALSAATGSDRKNKCVPEGTPDINEHCGAPFRARMIIDIDPVAARIALRLRLPPANSSCSAGAIYLLSSFRLIQNTTPNQVISVSSVVSSV